MWMNALLLLPVLAGAPAEGWVVIVRADASIPESWAPALQQAAQAAAKKNKAVRYVAPPQISTKEVELALGCQGWSATCAGQVASMLGADVTLTVDIVQRGRGAWLSTEETGANGAVRGARMKYDLPDREDAGLAAAKVFVAAAISGEPVTGLVIESDVIGAIVELDGKARGKTPLAVYELGPGPHTVVVTSEGRTPVTQEIDVKKGTIERLNVTLPEVVVAAEPVATTTTTTTTVATKTEPASAGLSPVLGWSVASAGGVICLLGIVAGISNLGIHYLYFSAYQPMEGETHREYIERTDGAALPDPALATPVVQGLAVGFYVAEIVGVVVAVIGGGLLGMAYASPDEPAPSPDPTGATE